MCELKIFFTLFLAIALVLSSPLPEDEQEAKFLTVNDLFKELNQILKRDIEKALANETDIEVGDKFSGKDKTSPTQISVQTFSFGANKFPVIFKPANESNAEDKEITSIKGDFEDSVSIFKIENEDDSKESTTKAQSDSSKALPTTVASTKEKVEVKNDKEKSKTPAETSTSKDDVLIKEIPKVPILTGA